MKLYEVMGTQQLQVLDTNDKETVLVDPKSSVKTVIPKDPKKPGMISPNEKGEFELKQKQPGAVAKELKKGDTVKVGQ